MRSKSEVNGLRRFFIAVLLVLVVVATCKAAPTTQNNTKLTLDAAIDDYDPFIYTYDRYISYGGPQRQGFCNQNIYGNCIRGYNGKPKACTYYTQCRG